MDYTIHTYYIKVHLVQINKQMTKTNIHPDTQQTTSNDYWPRTRKIYSKSAPKRWETNMEQQK